MQQTESILRQGLEKLKENEGELCKKNEELLTTEEKLRQNLEEMTAMQELIETQKKDLVYLNKKVLASEQIVKKAIVKIKEKEAEVRMKNEELAVMIEELRQSQEEIMVQRDMLETKNNLLENYTYKIDNSIAAAKMIQKAILPTRTKMKNLFEEYFVLFKPKDVVSGDFWWANEIDGEKYLIVADCTGHGVSGAMLSMIGSSLLDRIIRLLGITEPAEILDYLNREIRDLLQQDHTNNKEGMDIAIVHYHYENESCYLSFAAAKRPLYYGYQGKIDKVKGTRKNIGGALENAKSFESKTLTLPKDACFYLCSDGFSDQNNEERFSFSEKRLLLLLQQIQDLPMIQQKQVLKDQLADHMKGTEQRDDILLIGVRL